MLIKLPSNYEHPQKTTNLLLKTVKPNIRSVCLLIYCQRNVIHSGENAQLNNKYTNVKKYTIKNVKYYYKK